MERLHSIRGSVCVIGSGPAGTAAAAALLARRIPVTMLDIGVDLEPSRAELARRLSLGAPDTWAAADLEALKTSGEPGPDGLPQKRTYGSDFAVRDAGQTGEIDARDVDFLLSGARGGLSNLWGSNFMPYTAHDISDWCVSADELAPHYRAIAALVPHSAGSDDLEEWFPLYGGGQARLRPSAQARRLLTRLERHRGALRASGIVAGSSRLAVQVSPTPTNPHACAHCGLCLYGCPYNLIYSSRTTLDELRGRPDFRYIPGLIVDRVQEQGGCVQISARSLADQAAQLVIADRVFLACGAVATTRILLNSLGAFDRDVILKDSLYFLLPLLQCGASRHVEHERLHTLSQVFLEVHDQALSQRTIQLQVYTYNDLFARSLRTTLGPLFPFARPFLPSILGRLSLIMGYLHSDDSPGLVVTLRQTGSQPTLVLRPKPSERSRPVVRGVVRKLIRHAPHFGAVPLVPWLQVTRPGKGYHYGGTFPMAATPRPFETDRLGRPAGFQKVHAVDATVLPSIAATTIVYTAMANAHRIASETATLR